MTTRKVGPQKYGAILIGLIGLVIVAADAAVAAGTLRIGGNSCSTNRPFSYSDAIAGATIEVAGEGDLRRMYRYWQKQMGTERPFLKIPINTPKSAGTPSKQRGRKFGKMTTERGIVMHVRIVDDGVGSLWVSDSSDAVMTVWSAGEEMANGLFAKGMVSVLDKRSQIRSTYAFANA